MNTEQELKLRVENKILKGKLDIALQRIKEIKKDSNDIEVDKDVEICMAYMEFIDERTYKKLFEKYGNKIPTWIECELFYRFCKKNGYNCNI